MDYTYSANIPYAFQELFVPHRYKVYYGGRGGAKSHAMASALVILGQQNPLTILCCREIQLSINDSVKKILDDKIDEYGLRWFYRSTKTGIFGINGTVFIFAGLRDNISSLKSKEGIDICWVEEAETVTKTSIDILIPTIRKDNCSIHSRFLSMSEIWFSFNPKDEKSEVYQRFVVSEIKPPESFIKLVNYWDNPYFPETLRMEMEWDKSYDMSKYLHVWEGQLLEQTEAAVFKNWSTDVFEAPEDAIFYYGADWGFSNDPTVLLRCYIDDVKRILYIDYEAYRIGVEVDDLPDFFEEVPDSKKWSITADNARPELISHMKRHGFKVVGCKKGKGSIEDGIAFLHNYKIVVHQRCKHMIDELKLYSFKVDPKTEEILSVIVDKHNHCVDSARYSIEKLWKPKVLI